MNKFNEEYVQKAILTEAQNTDEIQKRFTKSTIRLLHSSIGLSTEAGELLDALKKHLYYGNDLDIVNLKEEMGDIFWYLAVLADELEIDFNTVMNRNIEKLQARYGDKFSQEKANKRDLEAERNILQQ